MRIIGSIFEFAFALVLACGFIALMLGVTGNTENFVHAIMAILEGTTP